jgi:hypothetical protein
MIEAKSSLLPDKAQYALLRATGAGTESGQEPR